jgi:hypothetical protein
VIVSLEIVGEGDLSVFSPTRVVIDAFVERVRENYIGVYGDMRPEFRAALEFVARMTLENIANSDAPYHDMEHTIMVTEVGQAVLRGKHVVEGGVSPRTWLNFVISLLCHDIGYVRGVCRGDSDPHYIVDESGATVTLPRGATDASMTPYHVNRAQIFVRERFANASIIDHKVIIENIEHTRFPYPDGGAAVTNDSLPGILRASDLIGQLADINYLKKIPRLFNEFQETGSNDQLGYTSHADLRESYPRFFWGMVSPFIDSAMAYLDVTQEGKSWVASLHAHVFVEEHKLLGQPNPCADA